MRAAIYTRVSTTRQAQTQTIEQQVTRLQQHVQQEGWTLDDQHVYRDEGYSGSSLARPGLDALRDAVTLAELDVVVLTAPDRLARKYVHQVLLIEELEQQGCQVVFLERPMSTDPHDQLVLQIRGAVAEYERTLITERMRRGRLAKLKAGQLLPWTRGLFGYRVDPERPRDPAAVRLEPSEAVIVQQIFAWYLQDGASLNAVRHQLAAAGIVSPRGRITWSDVTVRGVLMNPAYTGTTYGNRYQSIPAKRRKSALRPIGSGSTLRGRPPTDWIPVPIPAIVPQEVFDIAQEKLRQNQWRARRNNTSHEYLLRGLVSCGHCRLSATGRPSGSGPHYYVCQGRTDKQRAVEGRRCPARYIPAPQLDVVVWEDLCAILTEPEQVAAALERVRHGYWLPQELQARSKRVQQAIGAIERQQERLLEAYLAGVLDLAAFKRKQEELARHRDVLRDQQGQLDALVQQRIDLSRVADSIEEFCVQVRDGLKMATFAQRRALVELLIDRVIVTDSEVEICYVVPTSPQGPHTPFCHLRKDYLGRLRVLAIKCSTLENWLNRLRHVQVRSA